VNNRSDPFTLEDMSRLLAHWHGQKMIYHNRDGSQTVASSRGFGHWGDASDRYADKHWQEYTSAAGVVMLMIGPVIDDEFVDCIAGCIAEAANGGKWNDPLFYAPEHREKWREIILSALCKAMPRAAVALTNERPNSPDPTRAP
jgi:hypothetical protein